ncbi:hypothetical protein BGZ97_005264 [Linnemannia gamsii]|uniref:Uncharacterized protein n=1 Tax=Linnemannia gamsii TaxID=64522 RepID=A0A9P6REX8_9FUNG|nr:hypothetical protein BGZ97_005264 [Linnemannia gamsii]
MKTPKKKVKAETDRKNKEYNTQVQQQLCEQLGRLVKLRELTLEGCRYTGGGHKKRILFVCMHLTLETGLDYLRPLLVNLEKLVVYREGRLSGGAEVEWIDKNWVHHADTVWQHTFDTWDRQSYLEIPGEEACNRALYSSSKFRQLIGVDRRKQEGLNGASAAGDIAWLEYYWPDLGVVNNSGKSNGIVDSEDSDFIYGYQSTNVCTVQ